MSATEGTGAPLTGRPPPAPTPPLGGAQVPGTAPAMSSP